MTRHIPYSFLNLTFLVFFLLTPTMKLTIRRTTWEKHKQRRIEAPPALSRFWLTTKSWSQNSVPRDMYYVTISGRVCPANVAKTLTTWAQRERFKGNVWNLDNIINQVHATMGWESSKIPCHPGCFVDTEAVGTFSSPDRPIKAFVVWPKHPQFTWSQSRSSRSSNFIPRKRDAFYHKIVSISSKLLPFLFTLFHPCKSNLLDRKPCKVSSIFRATSTHVKLEVDIDDAAAKAVTVFKTWRNSWKTSKIEKKTK